MLHRRGQQRVRCGSLLGAIAAALPLGGCVTPLERDQQELESLYSTGQFQAAAEVLDKDQSAYGSKNEVLWQLNRGSIALDTHDADRAIDVLNAAEQTTELQTRPSAGDTIGQWVLNDTAAKYIPEPYEDVYINVIKILAQLEAGRIDGGATVEARRMAGKADRLRDRYLKYADASQKNEPAAVGSAPPPSSVVEVNKAGEFIESPLGTYLTAVTFMKSGDREFQRVAGKRLVSSIELQKGLIGSVRADDFRDLEERDPDSVNLLVVGLSGRGPTKYPERIGPIPLGTVPLYFELPYLRTYPSEVGGAHVEVDGDGGPGVTGRLDLVEDLSSVATVNHQRMLPLIYTRTLIRYAIKAGISVALTEAARRSAADRDQGLVQIAGVIAGLAVLGATEHADLRCWVLLPGQARVGLMKLNPGRHRVRVVYEGFGGGTVYASPWQDVDVSEGGLTSIVAHYWR